MNDSPEVHQSVREALAHHAARPGALGPMLWALRLLQEFGQGRYKLVERSQLAAIHKEHDLTIAQVVANPALLRGRKLKGLRY